MIALLWIIIVCEWIKNLKQFIMNSKVTISLFLIIALFLSSPSIYAQSGTGQIDGTVRDAVTNEVLIGASVKVEGTSLGSPTSVDGFYSIKRVPSGAQKITF